MTKRKGDVQEPVVLYKAREFMGNIETGSAAFTKTPNGWHSADSGSVFGFRRRFEGTEPPGHETPEKALDAFFDECREEIAGLECRIAEFRRLQRLAFEKITDLRREKGDDQ